MIANYGYRDGSGEFFITVDTDRCDGCGKCVAACPPVPKVLAVEPDDYDENKAVVVEAHRKKIKYSCAPCKPVGVKSAPPQTRSEATRQGEVAGAVAPATPPCIAACPPGAVSHSW